jgi:tRNA (guanosine-2'-O-)-methyltransferase
MLRQVLIALGCAGAAACAEIPRPATPAAPRVRDLHATGLQLAEVCSPSGIELCFDALDNNCNGVIDEGCGLHTGILQFTIAWQEPKIDVDLRVTGPSGVEARLEEPTEDGLIKDRECPREEQCHGQNVENVFLAEGAPRHGRYRVAVSLQDAVPSPPIKVRLSARVGQRHFTAVVELAEKNDERSFEFTL